MAKLKNIFSLLLRIAVSFLLLFLLFKFNKIDTKELFQEIKSADKFFLAAGFVIFFAVYLFGFLRWKMLLNAVGISIPLKKLISSFSAGVFFSIFLPSTIGGDLIKTADLAGHTKKAKEVFATVFLDRLSGYAGLVCVILLSLLLGRDLVLDKFVLNSVSMIVTILIIILLVLFNSFIYSKITRFLNTPGCAKLKDIIKNLHQEIHVFRNRKKVLKVNLLLSFFIQLINPISIYFIGLALGIKINFIYFLVFLPIIGAITLLPVSIGGLGLREYLFVLYFAKAGVIEQRAIAMSLLSFSFVVLYAAIGGLIYVFTIHHRRLQPHKPPAV
ncbi:MAG: lysylphosphatidylglycerol synthase transmembrane domain-containing protein [Candidatus Omnitrophica bacterium]|nr:lysylphosphatidylglycerol synthase transmembrane domain-containing protein [Candidatus Omnitrophota bacterium]